MALESSITRTLGSHRGDPSRAAYRRALADVTAELDATSHRVFPSSGDQLRRVCLLTEEIGEATKEALDIDRFVAEDVRDSIKQKLYDEVKQVAAIALRMMTHMQMERR